MAELDTGLRSHCMLNLSFESLTLTKMKLLELLKWAKWAKIQVAKPRHLSDQDLTSDVGAGPSFETKTGV